MKSRIVIESEELSKEDLRAILQVIRTTEHKFFPDKNIFIMLDTPELSLKEATDLLASLNPPLPYQTVLPFKHATPATPKTSFAARN